MSGWDEAYSNRKMKEGNLTFHELNELAKEKAKELIESRLNREEKILQMTEWVQKNWNLSVPNQGLIDTIVKTYLEDAKTFFLRNKQPKVVMDFIQRKIPSEKDVDLLEQVAKIVNELQKDGMTKEAEQCTGILRNLFSKH